MNMRALCPSLLFINMCMSIASCDGMPQKLAAASEGPCQPASVSEYDFSKVVYTQADSAEVVRLLLQKPNGNDVLFFARKFLGRPYVAYTLEVADPEQLVVNLSGLDCTTYVETVLALTLTHRQGGRSFADYCRNLEYIRYRGGVRDGYLSRLHYFAWWMEDNIEKGLVEEIMDQSHWSATMKVNDYYMTQHWKSYKMLAAHPEWVRKITDLERKGNGKIIRYLPQKFLNLNKKDLPAVHDGDVIAIVTTKEGLDFSHLGFVVWGKDGKMHLLNASMVYKKVVEDKNTFYKYMSERRTNVGASFLRLKNPPQLSHTVENTEAI